MFNKKKIKRFLNKSKIKEIDVTNIHKSFALRNISSNLKSPKEDSIIKSFSISPDNNIVGMTSDYEAWIISTLSKVSKNINLNFFILYFFQKFLLLGILFLVKRNRPAKAKLLQVSLYFYLEKATSLILIVSTCYSHLFASSYYI